MKKVESILIKGFHLTNSILIIFYLYPGSILGYLFYKDLNIQPQITSDFSISYFSISSNHFYVFIILSTIGIFAYSNTKKIKLSDIFSKIYHSNNIHLYYVQIVYV